MMPRENGSKSAASLARSKKLAELVSKGDFCDAIAVTKASPQQKKDASSAASEAQGEVRIPVVRVLLAAASPVLAEACQDLRGEGSRRSASSSVQAEVRLTEGITDAGLRCVLSYACDAVPAVWQTSVLEMPADEVRAVSAAMQVPKLEEWWQRQRSESAPSLRHKPRLVKVKPNLVAVNRLLLVSSILLSLAACYAWLPAFGYNFMENATFMDDAMIFKNRNVYEPLDLPRLLRTDYWGLEMFMEGVWTHKSFRPLTVLSFYLSHQLHGFASSGWHIGNVILHAISSVLLAFFGMVGAGLTVGWAAVLFMLFFSHPVHTENVLYIVGRADLLCCAILLIATIVYAPCVQRQTLRPASAVLLMVVQLVLTSVLLVLAGVSKETGFCFFGFLVGWEVLRGMLAPGRSWMHSVQRGVRLFALLVVGGLACWARVWYTSGTTIERMDMQSNPIAAHEDQRVRMLSYALVHGIYAKLLVWPTFLCYDYSMDAVPLVRTLEDVRLLLPLAAYSVGAQLLCVSLWPLRLQWLQVRSRKLASTLSEMHIAAREGPILGLAILLLSFLPMSNILFPVGTLVGERLLYIPSAGLLLTFCALGQLAVVAPRMRKGHAVLVVLSVSVVGAGFTWLTAKRVPDWASARSITLADGLKQIRSSRTQFNYANVHTKEKRYDEALLAYQRAINLTPQERDALPLYHGGQILLYQQRFVEAEAYLEQAVAGFYSPLTVREEEIFHDYALSLFFRSKAEESVNMFHASLGMNPLFPKSLNNLGCASAIGALSGKLPGNYLQYGMQVLDKAVNVDPSNVLYWRNVVAVLQHAGDNQGAQAAWDTLLRIDPTHAQEQGVPSECTWEFYFR